MARKPTPKTVAKPKAANDVPLTEMNAAILDADIGIMDNGAPGLSIVFDLGSNRRSTITIAGNDKSESEAIFIMGLTTNILSIVGGKRVRDLTGLPCRVMARVDEQSNPVAVAIAPFLTGAFYNIEHAIEVHNAKKAPKETEH